MARIFRGYRLPKYILYLVLFSTGLYHLIFYLLREKPIPFTTVTNYFLESGDSAKQGYIIDTPSCSILNLSPWDSTILPFVTRNTSRVDCGAELRKWTFTNGSDLIINMTDLERSGFSLNTVTCCYMTITRVDQSPDNFDFYADRKFAFSEDCTALTGIINPIQVEFVRVLCSAKYWPFSNEVLYRQFHALPQPSKSPVAEKIRFWKHSSEDPPPNVLIVGIDSMSRLSFHRNMKKTKEALERMGAVEMFGYTKVGDNTFPNALPILSGFLETEIRKMCLYTSLTPQDACPYIFKRFSAGKYVTALLEDVPGLATFHYLKTGFIREPADFYFRPFMLAVHSHSPTPWWTLDCIGYRTVDQVLLQYINDLLILSKTKRTPLFLWSWMTNLCHEDINAAKHGDETYANFLETADLENSILFFMSDHGYRYGSIRSTFPGWYEEKLPNLWIGIPPRLRERFPSWQKTLEVNSRRLTSPFDIYRTTSTVLDMFTSTTELPAGQTVDGAEVEGRKYGQFLFEEVPLLRQCKDAGIGVSFCACAIPNKLALNDSRVVGAATAAVDHLNSILPDQCAQLGLSSIVAGAVMRTNETSSTYLIAFITIPGHFVFEANVEYYGDSRVDPGTFSITTDFLRMSKIDKDVSCVKDGYLQQLCFCKFLIP